MALRKDMVIFERTVDGNTQYKRVASLNLNSRKAREAYEKAGWVRSAGKVAPVGVTAPAKSKSKAKPVETPDEQPEQNVEIS